MRRSLFLLLLLPLLAACRGTQLYTSQDLSQVKKAYAELKPTYLAFERAFEANNTREILSGYHTELHQCHLVDAIDQRDTIDPNINLFYASAELDNMCNAIELGYTTWASTRGYPYPHDIVPARPIDIFPGTDSGLLLMKMYLAKPSALAGPPTAAASPVRQPVSTPVKK